MQGFTVTPTTPSSDAQALRELEFLPVDDNGEKNVTTRFGLGPALRTRLLTRPDSITTIYAWNIVSGPSGEQYYLELELSESEKTLILHGDHNDKKEAQRLIDALRALVLSALPENTDLANDDYSALLPKYNNQEVFWEQWNQRRGYSQRLHPTLSWQFGAKIRSMRGRLGDYQAAPFVGGEAELSAALAPSGLMPDGTATRVDIVVRPATYAATLYAALGPPTTMYNQDIDATRYTWWLQNQQTGARFIAYYEPVPITGRHTFVFSLDTRSSQGEPIEPLFTTVRSFLERTFNPAVRTMNFRFYDARGQKVSLEPETKPLEIGADVLVKTQRFSREECIRRVLVQQGRDCFVSDRSIDYMGGIICSADVVEPLPASLGAFECDRWIGTVESLALRPHYVCHGSRWVSFPRGTSCACYSLPIYSGFCTALGGAHYAYHLLLSLALAVPNRLHDFLDAVSGRWYPHSHKQHVARVLRHYLCSFPPGAHEKLAHFEDDCHDRLIVRTCSRRASESVRRRCWQYEITTLLMLSQ